MERGMLKRVVAPCFENEREIQDHGLIIPCPPSTIAPYAKMKKDLFYEGLRGGLGTGVDG
jgi:hypothetical protein